MNKIKAVIFDLDNTLYNYTKADLAGKAQLYHYCESRFGLTEEEAKTLQNDMFQEQQRQMHGQAASHSRLIRHQMMLEKLEKPLFPHALAMCSAYWDTFLNTLEIEPGAVELLRALKLYGIRIGCGTNMTTWAQYEKIRRLNLGPYIDIMVTSEEAGAEKPETSFFMYLLQKTGCAPEECVFIGDNYKGDYLGSRAAGLRAVWYAGHAKSGDRQRETENPIADKIEHFNECLTDGGIRLGSYCIGC